MHDFSHLPLIGETQTGPNTFWVLTALRYAAVTGDFAWLSDYMPTLRKAAAFVFDLIDPVANLVFAPGSLMIDVFIRNNYTADSNAMVVGFIRQFADAERLVGEVGADWIFPLRLPLADSLAVLFHNLTKMRSVRKLQLE